MERNFPDVQAARQVHGYRPSGVTTLRQAKDVRWGVVGSALDYRIRYYFAVTPFEELIAFMGAAHCYSGQPAPIELWADCQEALGVPSPLSRRTLPESEKAWRANPERWPEVSFFLGLMRQLEALRPARRRLDASDEEVLNRYCVGLALYEAIARVGLEIRSPLFDSGRTVTEILQLATDAELADLCALSWAFYDGFCELLEKPAVLNPCLGFGQIGADADLIVDRCLIDIKTRIDGSLAMLESRKML